MAGWTVLCVAQSSPNGQWTVTARRGSQVVRAERLSADRVAGFDVDAYWRGGGR